MIPAEAGVLALLPADWGVPAGQAAAAETGGGRSAVKAHGATRRLAELAMQGCQIQQMPHKESHTPAKLPPTPMLALPGKLLRLTEGGVGCPGVPAYIGLLLKAPADRPLQYRIVGSRGSTWH
jgi:hypothetical protein